MEAVTVPGWFVYVMSGFFILIFPWGVWITRQIHKNDKDIAINTANDAKVEQELTKIHDLLAASNKDAKDRFDKIDDRFERLDDKLTQFLMQGNAFLSQEVTFMKKFLPQ